MSDASAAVETTPKTGKLKPILIGLGLALALGGAGFYATYSGMLDLSGKASDGHAAAASVPDVTFVPVDPILVSFSSNGQSRHLRFRADLEVAPLEAANVEALMPRVLDVLNSYLRALEIEELERPTALIRIRAQMLRRVQMVVGEDRVEDLLVTEFVLN
ncbi:flagellar basal body-associated FliL family protein [Tropicimonas sediminicola]|uniref:Flagellar protein FliL n=1 Tax=Tropicimonas sediminicola TaxID=1031541 RepID=A0A239JD13_9RHOB|nr:flagellar basal body-associated FliL family protein [Tropicimonas sediminicola]SNT03730.1 flagellar FliL protein [Tropicimonas sediminicola]